MTAAVENQRKHLSQPELFSSLELSCCLFLQSRWNIEASKLSSSLSFALFLSPWKKLVRKTSSVSWIISSSYLESRHEFCDWSWSFGKSCLSSIDTMQTPYILLIFLQTLFTSENDFPDIKFPRASAERWNCFQSENFYRFVLLLNPIEKIVK